MREILFRGKRVDNGEWVKGFYVNVPEHYKPEMSGKSYIVSINNGISFEVIPETVGEYTGLPDKNGTEIFEGDIVRGKDCIGCMREGSVFYDNYYAMYMIKPNTKSEYREVNCFTSLTPVDAYLEVIGNIHDNPELLQEDKQ